MALLVLVRHGQSQWNLENRFTGWIDVPLTAAGEEEARVAGDLLNGYRFQVAYTSMLTRAQKTLEILCDTLGQHPPVIRDQALNERHYGDLQGLNKEETAAQYGEDQVRLWRRSFDIAPPGGESLKDTLARTRPFFERAILGDIRQGKNVLIVAHGNSNRSIVMSLDDLSPEEVLRLELATGIPVVYEMDDDCNVRSKRTLEP